MVVDWLDTDVLRPGGHLFDYAETDGLGPEILSGLRQVYATGDGVWTARFDFTILRRDQREAMDAFMARLSGMTNVVDIPVPAARLARKHATGVLVGPHAAHTRLITVSRGEFELADLRPGHFIGVDRYVHQVTAINPNGALGIELTLRNGLRRAFDAQPGEELIVNGGFDSDLTGWTAGVAGSSTVAWSAGVAEITRVSGANAYIYQALDTTVGRRYRLSAGIGTDGLVIRLGSYANNNAQLNQVPGTAPVVWRGEFLARYPLTYLTITAYTDGAKTLDDVSVRADDVPVVTTRPTCRMRLSSPGQGRAYYEQNKFGQHSLAFIEEPSVLDQAGS